MTVDAAADVTSKRQEVGYSERSCYTFDNKRGYCRTVQECYKLTKLHQQISNLETWILGTRGTCNYVEPTGRQVRQCFNSDVSVLMLEFKAVYCTFRPNFDLNWFYWSRSLAWLVLDLMLTFYIVTIWSKIKWNLSWFIVGDRTLACGSQCGPVMSKCDLMGLIRPFFLFFDLDFNTQLMLLPVSMAIEFEAALFSFTNRIIEKKNASSCNKMVEMISRIDKRLPNFFQSLRNVRWIVNRNVSDVANCNENLNTVGLSSMLGNDFIKFEIP